MVWFGLVRWVERGGPVPFHHPGEPARPASDLFRCVKRGRSSRAVLTCHVTVWRMSWTFVLSPLGEVTGLRRLFAPSSLRQTALGLVWRTLDSATSDRAVPPGAALDGAAAHARAALPPGRRMVALRYGRSTGWHVRPSLRLCVPAEGLTICADAPEGQPRGWTCTSSPAITARLSLDLVNSCSMMPRIGYTSTGRGR